MSVALSRSARLAKLSSLFSALALSACTVSEGAPPAAGGCTAASCASGQICGIDGTCHSLGGPGDGGPTGPVAGPPNASNSFFSLAPADAVADGRSAGSVTVTLLDDKFQPVPGQTVNVAASGEGVAVSDTPSLTGPDGRATARIFATQAGHATITVEVSPSQGSKFTLPGKMFSFIAGAPSQAVFRSSPTSTAAGNTLASTQVAVLDVNGNLVSGSVPVTLSLSGGAGLSGTLTQSTVSGVATFGDLQVTQAGRAFTLSAVLPPSLQALPAASGSFDVTAAAPSAATSTSAVTYLSTGGSAAADGNDGVRLQIRFIDAFGNGIAGAAVSFTVSGAQSTVTPASGLTTAADGTASAVVTSTSPGGKTVAIAVTPAGGAQVALQPLHLNFVAGIPSAGGANLSVPASAVIADGSASAPLVVTVQDSAGNPVQGATVVFSTTGSANLLGGAQGQTGADGTATATLGSTIAEQKYLTATVTPAHGSPFTLGPKLVAFVAGPLARVSFLSALGALPAGTIFAPQRIGLFDSTGNPILAATDVHLAITASTGTANALLGGTVTQKSQGGIATFANLSITTAGTAWSLTATAGSASGVSGPFDIATLPVSPLKSTLRVAYAGTATSAPADGAANATLTLTAVDGWMNPIAGALVTLSVTGSGNTLTPSAGLYTDQNGAASATVSSTVAESKTVVATVTPSGGVAIPLPGQSLGFVAGPLSALAFVNAPANLVAGGTLTTLKVSARDAQGNSIGTPVQVSLALTPGSGAPNGRLTGNAAAMTAQGTATLAGLSIAAAGTAYSLTATASGAASATSASFNVATGALSVISSPVLLSFVNGPDNTSATADGASYARLQFTAQDSAGNPIANAPIALAVSGSGNSFPASAATGADGTADLHLASTVAEVKTLSLSVTSGGASFAFPQQTATFAPGALSKLVFLSAPTGTEPPSLALPLTRVAAQDALGNLVTPSSNILVTLAGGAAGSSLSGSQSRSAVGGVSTFNDLAIAALGQGYTLTASLVGLASGPTATCVPFDIASGSPGAISSGLTIRYAGSATSALDDGNDAAQISVRLVDANGKPVVGAAVALSVTGSANGLAPGTSLLTGPTGFANATLTSTFAEAKTVTAVVTPPGAAPVTLAPQSAIFRTGPVSQLTLESEPGSTVAGGTLSNLVVTQRDAQGNVVTASGSVTLTITAGTGGANPRLTGSTTVATQKGVATFRGLILKGAGAGYTLTATSSVSGVPPGVTDPFDVAPAALSATASTVAAAYQKSGATSAVADGSTDSVTVKISLVDAFANPIVGAQVAIAVSGSNNSLSPPSGLVTQSDGTASAVLTSTTSEQKSVSATVTPAGGSPIALLPTQVSFVAGPLFALSFQGPTPASTTAGAILQTMRVAARDAQGNLVLTTASITLAITPNTGTRNAALLPAAPVSTLNGVATFSGLSIVIAGTGYSLTAAPTAGGSTVQSAVTLPFDLATGPLDPNFSTFMVFYNSGSSATADASDSARLVVTALDNNQNPIRGAQVSFNISGSGNAQNPSAGLVTGPDGKAELHLSSTVAETKTIGAALSSGSVSLTLAQQTASFVAGPFARLAFLAAPIGQYQTGLPLPAVRIAPIDSLGNVRTGADTLSLALTGPAGGSLSGAGAAVASVNGVATFAGLVVSGPNTGYTLTATLTSSSQTAVSGAFDITAGPPGPPTSTLQVSFAQGAASAVANGSDAATLTVHVVDSSGRPVGGAAVAFAASGSANSISPPSGLTTDSSGSASASLTSTTAETKNISATATPPGGGAITLAPKSAVFVAGALSQLAFDTQPATTSATNTFPVRVSARDAFGNLVASPASAISLAIAAGSGNPSGVLGGPATTVTTVKGVAQFQGLSLIAAGQGYTLTASVGSLSAQSNSFDITPGPISPKNSSVRVVGSPVTADGIDAATLNVTLQDSNANPISGAAISFAATGTGSSFSPPSGLVTDSSGLASATLSSTVAELKSVTTTATPQGSTAVTLSPAVSVSFVAGGVASLTFLSQPASTTANAQLALTKVVARDAQGNLVLTPLTIALTVTGNAKQSLGPNAQALTASGVASFRGLTITQAGPGYSLTASLKPAVNGVANVLTDPFDVGPGPVNAASSTFAVTYQRAPLTFATADNQDFAIAAVTAVDGATPPNPIPGVAVSFTASGSSNSQNPASGLVTGAGGVAQMKLSSSKAEQKSVQAVLTVNGVATTLAPLGASFVAGPLQQLLFVSSPGAAVQTGQSLPSTRVALADQFSNVITSSTQGVTIALTPGTAPAGSLTGTFLQPAVNGIATFTGLAITQAALSAQLHASAAGAVAADSAPFAVQAPVVSGVADPTQSVVTILNAAGNHLANNKDAINVRLTALDSQGRPLQGQTTTILTSPSAGTLSTTALTDALGNAFLSLTATKPGTYQIGTQISNGSSTPTVIPTGAVRQTVVYVLDPTQLSGTVSTITAPATAPVGGNVNQPANSTQVVVTANDAFGNALPGITCALTLSGTGVTQNTATATSAADGTCPFYVVSTVAELKTINAIVRNGASAALPVAPASITFTPGIPNSLAFSGAPLHAQPGANLVTASGPPSVQVLDVYRNVATQISGTMSLTLGNNPSGTAFTPVSQPIQAGVATFSGLSLSQPARGYTLAASYATGGSVFSAASAPFAILVPQFPGIATITTTNATPAVSTNVSWTVQSLASPPAALAGFGLYGAFAASLATQPAPQQIGGSVFTGVLGNFVPLATGTPAVGEVASQSALFTGFQPDAAAGIPITGGTLGGMFLEPVAFDGGYLLAGYTQAAVLTVGTKPVNAVGNGNTTDCLFARLNPDFSVQWAARYGGSACFASGAVAFPDGSSAFIGTYSGGTLTPGNLTVDCGANCSNIFVIRFDANGTRLWANHVGLGASAGNFAFLSASKILRTADPSTPGLVIAGTLGQGAPNQNAQLDFYPGVNNSGALILGGPTNSGGACPPNCNPGAQPMTFVARLDAGSGAVNWADQLVAYLSATAGSQQVAAFGAVTLNDLAITPDNGLTVLASVSNIVVNGNGQTLTNPSALLGFAGQSPGSAGGFPTAPGWLGGAGKTVALNSSLQSGSGSASGNGLFRLPAAMVAGSGLQSSVPSASAPCTPQGTAATCTLLGGAADGSVLVLGNYYGTPATLAGGSLPTPDLLTGLAAVRIDNSLAFKPGTAVLLSSEASGSASAPPIRLLMRSDGAFSLLGNVTGFSSGQQPVPLVYNFGLGTNRQGVHGASNSGAAYVAMFGPDSILRWVDQVDGDSSASSAAAFGADGSIAVGLLSGGFSSGMTLGSDDWDPVPTGSANIYLGHFTGGNFKTLFFVKQ